MKSFIVNVQSLNSKTCLIVIETVTQRVPTDVFSAACVETDYWHYAMLQWCFEFNFFFCIPFRARNHNVLVVRSASVENTTLI